MKSLAGAIATLVLSVVLGTPSNADLFATDDFKLSADFRLRFETDFDSQTAAGTPRDDRTRVRTRFRLSARYEASEAWSLGLRLRSGSEDSHQSPHVTLFDLDDNDTGDSDFRADRWYVRFKREGVSAWAGRNSFPFWAQNELLWDQDVTLPGVAASWSGGDGPARIGVTGGFFSLPVGLSKSSGTLGAVQVRYGVESETGFQLAATVLEMDANRDDPEAGTALNGNGRRDYRILSLSGQANRRLGGHRLVVGLDLMRNLEDYPDTDPDPFTVANRDETDGYALSVAYGETSRRGDWLVAWVYARIETLAVNSSFSEDDWVRWGSATETRASNMKGHELRFAYRLPADFTLVARLYRVRAITNDEDGSRMRVDFNRRF